MRRLLVIAAASLTAAVLMLAAADNSSAWAAWGCAATAPNGAKARNAAVASETVARDLALEDCRRNGGKGCKIIGCNAKVDTIEEARRLWPFTATWRCGTQFGIKCPK